MLHSIIQFIGRDVPGSQLYGAVLFVLGIHLVIAVVESLITTYARKRRAVRIAKEEYAKFEKLMFTASSPDEHQEKRQKLMSSFLSSQDWTMGDVSQLLISPYLSRDYDGWLIPDRHLRGKLEIAEFKGFMIDFTQPLPSIKILFKPATNGNGLLSFDDVYTILNLRQEEAECITFSLDPPPESASEQYHPFNVMRCKPASLQNSNIMKTLFHADYLLKFFTVGMEVSAKPPFHMRPILDNLVKHLPSNLLRAIQPPFARRVLWTETGAIIHRFWIELKKLAYSTTKNKNKIAYFIEEINMNVKCERLRPNSSGQLCGTNSAEREEIAFINDFTSHYDELSKYFPILARLRELSKLQFLQNMILKKLKELQEDVFSKARFKALNSEITHLCSLFHLNFPSPGACNWVPSAHLFCNPCRCFHGVYGGVTLKPMYEQCTNKTTIPIQSLQHHQPSVNISKLPSSYKQYYSSAGGSVDIPRNESLPPAQWSDAQQELGRVQHLSDAFISESTPKYSPYIPKNESSSAAKWSNVPRESSRVPCCVSDGCTSESISKNDGGIRFNTNSGHKHKSETGAIDHSDFVWAELGNISECDITHDCKRLDDRDDQSNKSENNLTKDSNSSQILYANKDACVLHRFSVVRERIITLDQLYALLTRSK